jgi:hypothetical protein
MDVVFWNLFRDSERERQISSAIKIKIKNKLLACYKYIDPKFPVNNTFIKLLL